MEKKEIKECVSRFEKFITNEINVSDLFKVIDNVMYEYAKYVMEDSSFCGGSPIESRNMFYLKVFRDILKSDES